MNESIAYHESLVLPISAESPTGVDVRADEQQAPLYYELREARTRARQVERLIQQQPETAQQKPDWREVIRLATALLTYHTKDLEIAAWLTEALLREQGFSGLTQGFLLLTALVEKYWGNLYPLPDEEGIATTLAALTGLNGDGADGTLIVPIAMVLLIDPQHPQTFALWQYQQSLDAERIIDPEKKAIRFQQGVMSLHALESAMRESSPLQMQDIRQSLTDCFNAFLSLEQCLADQCGDDAPPSSRIKAQLQACIDCYQSILSDNSVSLPEVHVESIEQTQHNFPKESAVEKTGLTREQALGHLLHVADFFRKTEPHSPISYMLERVVRWGRLPLPELLKELISDEKVRESLVHLTGIQ